MQEDTESRLPAALAEPVAGLNQETETKQETEVDLPVEEAKQKPYMGIPVELTIIQPDFMVEKGAITGMLYSMRTISCDIDKVNYRVDTVNKAFGRVFRGRFTTTMLSDSFFVDKNLMNPITPSDFKIRNKVVPLAKDHNFPFAILSGTTVIVVWTKSETYRDHWVKALESIRPQAENGSAPKDTNNAIQMNQDNWYCVQAYAFLKREYELQKNPNALLEQEQLLSQNNSNAQIINTGEEGGGERAVNPDDDEEQKVAAGFTLQTVANNDEEIKGYLYKTVQSLGLMQSTYFLRRYYVLNKKSKLLTVHDKPNGKVQHQFKLDECLIKVHTDLNSFLKPDYTKHFQDKPKNLQLPNDNPLPMALFIFEKCKSQCCQGPPDMKTFAKIGKGHQVKLSILWASTDADYDLWVKQFASCSYLKTNDAAPQIEKNGSNKFITSLYSALVNNLDQQKSNDAAAPRRVSRPRIHSMDARRAANQEVKGNAASYQSATLLVTDSGIEGTLMKTSQSLGKAYQSCQYFYKRYYKLDQTTKTLYIHRVGKEKADLVVKLYEPEHQVIEVDQSLSSNLVINYHAFFKTELPTDLYIPKEFPLPLAVRLENNQIMILWLASLAERSIWAQAFLGIMQNSSNFNELNRTVPKLQTVDKNEFIATLYQCLVPANSLASKAPTSNSKGFRIRIVQQGILMKTSQKCNKRMQKTNYHMRFFEMNVSTQVMKVYNDLTPKKKVKHSLDLRNKVVAVVKLLPKLKPNYGAILGAKVAESFDSTLPHDFKFPFAVVYVSNKQLNLMLMWAQNQQSQKEWIDAFAFVTVDSSPYFQKDVPIYQQIEAQRSKLYITQLFLCLQQDSGVNEEDQNQPSQIKDEAGPKNNTPVKEPSPVLEAPKSDEKKIEEAWDWFKKETPVEKLISGQDTFQIRSKNSMGIIRARKETFDNNYDPDTIIKCFLLIDFESNLIGIRSVDAGFSALVGIKATELVRIQDNDFDIHAQDEGSERLTNTIDLVLARKVVSIAPNYTAEKSMLVNELNRALIVQQMNKELMKSDDPARIQKYQMKAANQQHRDQAQDQSLKEDENIPVSRRAKILGQGLTRLSQNEIFDDQQSDYVESSNQLDKNVHSQPFESHQINEIPSQQKLYNERSTMGTNRLHQQRRGRFQRESDEDQQVNRHNRQDRYDEMQNQLHSANNQQDADPQYASQQDSQPTEQPQPQARPQVIALKNIKFKLGPESNRNLGETRKVRTNSFFEEKDEGAMPKDSEMQKADRIIRFNDQNQDSKHNSGGPGMTVDFFKPQSASNRQALFQQQSDSAAPMRVKLTKKRTEDSQVRQSLKESIMMNQTVQPDKIDFHKTVQFRSAFPDNSGASAAIPGLMNRAARPLVINTGEDYEQKIQASRAQGFIDNLMDGQMAPSQHQSNRFMSPALRVQTQDSAHQDFTWKQNHKVQAPQTPQVMASTQPMGLQVNTSKHEFANPTQFMAPAQLNANEQSSFQQNENGYGNMMQQSREENNFDRKIATGQQRIRPHERRQAYASATPQAQQVNLRPKQDDGDLSDWDDDSGDEFNHTMNKQVVNVRDRTFSLSNVYTGQILSPAASNAPRVKLGRTNSVAVKDLEVEDWD